MNIAFSDIPFAPDRETVLRYRAKLDRDAAALNARIDQLRAVAEDPNTGVLAKAKAFISFNVAAFQHVNVRAKANCFSRSVAKTFPDMPAHTIARYTF